MSKTIAICASVSFYENVVVIKNQLVSLGYQVIMPMLAELMEKQNDYRFESYKDSFYKGDFYGRKAEAIHDHFKKIEESNAILVVNNEKHGVPGYIGPNVLMEMAIAFHYQKSIFILNKLAENPQFLDEITAMKPTFLNGNLNGIKM